MTTINGLLEKYQKIECLFMAKEITEFRQAIEEFRRDQCSQIMNLKATNDKGQHDESIRLLENLIGKNF